MKVDSDIGFIAASLPQSSKAIGCARNEGRRSNNTGLGQVADACFEGRETFGPTLAEQFRTVADVSIDADTAPCWAAEQFINGHSQRLALDIPQGHVD